jgi:hypothetical protein
MKKNTQPMLCMRLTHLTCDLEANHNILPLLELRVRREGGFRTRFPARPLAAVEPKRKPVLAPQSYSLMLISGYLLSTTLHAPPTLLSFFFLPAYRKNTACFISSITYEVYDHRALSRCRKQQTSSPASSRRC